MWNLESLIEHAQSTRVFENGKWISARPVNHKYRSLPQRIKEAWAVFTGEADAVRWPGNQ